MSVPGPRSRALARRLRQVESRNITYVSDEFPVFWQSAHGSWVRDVDGRKYLDLTSAFAVSSLGHTPPFLRQALVAQSSKLWHGMGDVHPTEAKVELLEKLAAIAPGRLGVAILSSSGAEAVESALKTARLYTGKPGVITFEGSYHGLSYGTLGLTDRCEFSAPFRDQIALPARSMPFPDSLRGPSEESCLHQLDNFLKLHHASFGAVLFEPIQGRGGIRVLSPAFVRALRQITRRYKLLLIADEIMTGLCRTGRTFAVDHAGIVPDLLCIGKALANGFPMSACIGTPEVMAAWPPSDGEAIHTSTFLGNPLGCAMALAALKEHMRGHWAARALKLGQAWKLELQRELGAHPRVGEIRGLGFMIGIVVVKDKKQLAPDPIRAQRLIRACLQRGLIVLSGGRFRNVLSLTPPLTIKPEELSLATRRLKEVFYGTASSGD